MGKWEFELKCGWGRFIFLLFFFFFFLVDFGTLSLFVISFDKIKSKNLQDKIVSVPFAGQRSEQILQLVPSFTTH